MVRCGARRGRGVRAPDRFLPGWARPLPRHAPQVLLVGPGLTQDDVAVSVWGARVRRDVLTAEVVLREPLAPPGSLPGDAAAVSQPTGPRHGRLQARADGVLFVERPAPGGRRGVALWVPRGDLTSVAADGDAVRMGVRSWQAPLVVAPAGTGDPAASRQLAADLTRRTGVGAAGGR